MEPLSEEIYSGVVSDRVDRGTLLRGRPSICRPWNSYPRKSTVESSALESTVEHYSVEGFVRGNQIGQLTETEVEYSAIGDFC